MSALSGLVGAVREAWDELRVHRTRVLLSLIGVGVAVCALTSVVGVGQIAQQAQTEQLERGGGRPATLVLGAPYDPVTGAQGDNALLADVVATAVERYSIEYSGVLDVGPAERAVRRRREPRRRAGRRRRLRRHAPHPGR